MAWFIRLFANIEGEFAFMAVWRYHDDTPHLLIAMLDLRSIGELAVYRILDFLDGSNVAGKRLLNQCKSNSLFDRDPPIKFKGNVRGIVFEVGRQIAFQDRGSIQRTCLKFYPNAPEGMTLALES